MWRSGLEVGLKTIISAHALGPDPWKILVFLYPKVRTFLNHVPLPAGLESRSASNAKTYAIF